jgi:CRISPR-associated protein Csm3
MTPRQGHNSQRQFIPGKRLIACWKFSFKIKIEDGTAIHGNETGLEIGSAVQPNLRVIVNPITARPYLPGSSLKGKLRSTLERSMVRPDGKPGAGYDSETGQACTCGRDDCMACVIFGCANPGKKEARSSPTRIVVRDAQLTKESAEFWDAAYAQERPQLEQKIESFNNRASGAALNPRTSERLLPGTEFQGEIVIRQFEKDDAAKFLGILKKVMRFVEETDGLGSGISRGSGRISFPDLDTSVAVEVKAPKIP